MKSLIFIMFCMFSLNAFAFPKEGDYARFLAFHKGDTYEYKKSIIEYYPDRHSYLVISKLSKNEETLYEIIIEQAHTWFYTEAKVQHVFESCVRREGALGDTFIQGVKVKTCTFHNEDSQLDYSIGMVPFGQIRFQEYLGHGEFLDFNLVDFL